MKDAHVRWQCRRGMRELDELLVGWFEHEYADASDTEKASFRELLTLPDPLLAGYLLGYAAADGVSASVIERIRNRAHAGPAAP